MSDDRPGEHLTSSFRLPQRVVFIVIGVVVVFLTGFGVYRFFVIQKELDRLKSSPTSLADAAKTDAQQLVTEVGKLIVLPAGETPTVATVTDASRLQANPFFANAKKGDRVLIYTKAKKAILYRPGEHKIVDVGPISVGPTTTAAQQTPSFVLLNGTSVVGLTKKYEVELKGKTPNAVVADRDNAKGKNYTTTLLVDVKGDKAQAAQQLAQSLGVTLSPLPAGESTPSADFLIIIGADKK